MDTFGGRIHVEWDPQATVTPMGQLPFFIEFLKWVEAGQGWQGTEAELRLCGWSRPRRVLVLRRRVTNDLAVLDRRDRHQLKLGFTELYNGVAVYEYSVLVTSLDAEILTIAQLYRGDRADAENPFDELKNHRGRAASPPKIDLKRCRFMARITALVYNGWSLFVRWADPNPAYRGHHLSTADALHHRQTDAACRANTLDAHQHSCRSA